MPETDGSGSPAALNVALGTAVGLPADDVCPKEESSVGTKDSEEEERIVDGITAEDGADTGTEEVGACQIHVDWWGRWE